MIRLQNVSVNNLKGVDLEIPHGQLLAFCGLSGSGKSSLAFDTLYAEGQRRYLESLSPQTRQWINQLEKPDAELIDGIPPAIAVKAFRGKVGRKATVGTATEVTHLLRLLFARIGQIICPNCNSTVSKNSPQQVAQLLFELDSDCRYQVVFESYEDSIEQALVFARRNGFVRAVVAGKTIDLAQTSSDKLHEGRPGDSCFVIVDRLKANSPIERILESVEIAFQFGGGKCQIWMDQGWPLSSMTIEVDQRRWNVASFSTQLACESCGEAFPPPEPRWLSFNSSAGQCPVCEGSGFVDPMDREVCDVCQGTRLNAKALAYRVAGKSLGQLGQISIESLLELIDSMEFSRGQTEIAKRILPKIKSKLGYLCQVGLKYLTLDRSIRTLSAGEAQRVSLTGCLSSTLVNLMYVLDEPSVGLHSHDVLNLKAAIQRLHANGNTVIVVDHHQAMLKSVERIVEIGPGAGTDGGEIVFDGTVDEMLDDGDSLTGEFLSGERGSTTVSENRRSPRGKLSLKNARGNNLKGINVDFPLGCLCVVTGVSGSGKSSLVQQTLYGAVCGRKGQKCETPLPYDDVFGDSQIDDIVLVDHSPIGRSARSNPVTYVKAFDEIRKVFAETVDAKTQNIKPGQFSFNVAGGRCNKCEGAGQISIDMNFMTDIHVKCDLCNGTRYRDEILTVKYRGKTISEVLNLTVNQAFPFFRGQPKVQSKLKALLDVGLGYIKLGQPATTVSSGEAQRLKLAHFLNASKSRRALFVLDEPTTGLHMRDVVRLYDCFESLLSVGHSLIIVEHNLQLIKYADWVIDLGPGAGDEGGSVICEGAPEVVAQCEESITGQYLKSLLEF